jgi:hypothetical protein
MTSQKPLKFVVFDRLTADQRKQVLAKWSTLDFPTPPGEFEYGVDWAGTVKERQDRPLTQDELETLIRLSTTEPNRRLRNQYAEKLQKLLKASVGEWKDTGKHFQVDLAVKTRSGDQTYHGVVFQTHKGWEAQIETDDGDLEAEAEEAFKTPEEAKEWAETWARDSDFHGVRKMAKARGNLLSRDMEDKFSQAFIMVNEKRYDDAIGALQAISAKINNPSYKSRVERVIDSFDNGEEQPDWELINKKLRQLHNDMQTDIHLTAGDAMGKVAKADDEAEVYIPQGWSKVSNWTGHWFDKTVPLGSATVIEGSVHSGPRKPEEGVGLWAAQVRVYKEVGRELTRRYLAREDMGSDPQKPYVATEDAAVAWAEQKIAELKAKYAPQAKAEKVAKGVPEYIVERYSTGIYRFGNTTDRIRLAMDKDRELLDFLMEEGVQGQRDMGMSNWYIDRAKVAAKLKELGVTPPPEDVAPEGYMEEKMAKAYGWVENRVEGGGSGKTSEITSPAGLVYYATANLWAYPNKFETLVKFWRITPPSKSGTPFGEEIRKKFEDEAQAKDWCVEQLKQFEEDAKGGKFDPTGKMAKADKGTGWLGFMVIVDDRFDKDDLNQLIQERISAYKAALSKLPNLSVTVENPRPVSFPSESSGGSETHQVRAFITVNKTTPAPTWRDIMRAVNSVKAARFQINGKWI